MASGGQLWSALERRASPNSLELRIRNSRSQVAIATHGIAESVNVIQAGRDHDAGPVVGQGPHLGLPINLGTFSRNRPLDADGPVNVLG